MNRPISFPRPVAVIVFCMVLQAGANVSSGPVQIAGRGEPANWVGSVWAVNGGGNAENHVTLYFPRGDRPGLRPEKRTIDPVVQRADRIRVALNALFEGSRQGSTPAWFTNQRPRQVFVDRAGGVTIDLTAPSGPDAVADVGRERLFLWALVNTVGLNFKEIKSVKILVEGGEKATLFGHIDLARPLRPDESLIDHETDRR